MDFDSDDFKVFIKANALLSLIAPIIEDYSKEVGGFITGNIENQWLNGKHEPLLTIQSIYPSVSAKGTSNEWVPIKAALKRARDVAETLSLTVLGGYHSHPLNGLADLSVGDKDFIRDEKHINYCEIDDKDLSWLELVVRIDKKEHVGNKNKESVWYFKNSADKVSGNIYLSNSIYFSITIGSFGYFKEDDSFNTFPVYLENMLSHEPSE